MTKEFVCTIHVHQHVLYTQSILVINQRMKRTSLKLHLWKKFICYLSIKYA